MSENTYIQIEDDDDIVVDVNAGQCGGDAVATLETTPVDFYTPDLNLPASELDTSTVSNLKNHPSRSRIFLDPDVYGGNQVSFAMDLFGQRIELSGHDPNFGVVEYEDEDVQMDNMDDPEFDPNWDPDFGYDEDVDGYSGIFCANCGDEFVGSSSLSEAGNSLDLVEHDFLIGDLDIESESSSQRGNGVMDDFALGDDNVNDFAFVNDSGLQIYLRDNVDVNNNNNNHDFEWEEIGGSVDEGDVLSMFFQGEADDDDASVVPQSGQVNGREINETMGNLEWEVLLNIHNLEVNHGFGLDDDYGGFTYNVDVPIEDYETLFAQFGENDNTFLGRPPASKAVVENLDSVLIVEEDVENDNVICAVCKDEMNVGERAKQLPCSHRYHGDCIVPWLGIRNTCPVCRYELPIDDPDYELRKRGLLEVQVQ